MNNLLQNQGEPFEENHDIPYMQERDYQEICKHEFETLAWESVGRVVMGHTVEYSDAEEAIWDMYYYFE